VVDTHSDRVFIYNEVAGKALRLFTRLPSHRSADKRSANGENTMNALKIVAIVLIVAGSLGLVYGGFTYTKDTHAAKLGPIELSVKDRETINIPVWAGVGAIAAGVILLFVRARP
jgi:hypothetical protein